jgi:outer membrane protein W
MDRLPHHAFRRSATRPDILWLILMVGLAWLTSVPAARAETYIAAQAGYTIPRDTARGRATDPENAGLPAGTSVGPVKLDGSPLYGMKLGHYFESVRWLGVELETFVTTPHRPQQHIKLGVPGMGTVHYVEPGATNRLIVLSPLLVARYRAGSLEPYVGVGPGIFWLHQNQAPVTAGGRAYSQSSTGVGLNTQVGLRYRVTDHLSVFAEWKYNYAKINLPGQADAGHFGINAVVNLHHAVFGIAYHF